MLILYNILQVLALIVVGPLLFVKVILTAKYRQRLPQRLGLGLDRTLVSCPSVAPRIWIHALSVGEVSSSHALVKALRVAFPDITLIFSTTTEGGAAFAKSTLGNQVDFFIPFPVDLLPCVSKFLDLVDPDLFLLVETDFWPNFLHELKKRQIPAVLVNGRISRRSFALYRRWRFFFRPLFDSFAAICMQTVEDVERMLDLGVAAKNVMALGNLKYEAAGLEPVGGTIEREDFGIPADRMVWAAGSTHPGEDEMVLRIHKRLLADFPDLLLLLAPRQVARGESLAALAEVEGLAVARRSLGGGALSASVLLLDTIGELSGSYRLCELAFVGGSLVAEGGHNPLEPAAFGRPVLFGPHMEDFLEVSQDLKHAGGAIQVKDEEELYQRILTLLADDKVRDKMGKQSLALLEKQQGATGRHVELIRSTMFAAD
ncbi:MAG: 3-deoxy-D-manno-octulosonic acid transferase [Desulfobulbaceae bacterium]|nr:3-deoxy-D-manno-octulosonic acid transferase [Desulfobulbaceae bacterium]